MAMQKAADAVAAHAEDRAAAKRSKASAGLVVDIVASATVNAVHTWPMDAAMSSVCIHPCLSVYVLLTWLVWLPAPVQAIRSIG